MLRRRRGRRAALAATLRAARRLPAGEYYFLLLASVTGALAAGRQPRPDHAGRRAGDAVAAGVRAGRAAPLRRRASEAALKLFLVSVVSTAVTLFGVSLVYGVTGACTSTGSPPRWTHVPADLRAASLRLGVVAGRSPASAFKVAAVPFHFWAPDTYEGAPLPVAAYLSVVSKAAGFVGLALLLTVGFAPYGRRVGAAARRCWRRLTMTRRQPGRAAPAACRPAAGLVVGGAGRLHAGAAGRRRRRRDARRRAAGHRRVRAALYARHEPRRLRRGDPGRPAPRRRTCSTTTAAWPAPTRSTAFALAFFLACLAGLPPGLLGLFAKVVVFRAPVDQGVGWLAVVMAVNTVIGLYYYLAWAARALRRAPTGRRARRRTASPGPTGWRSGSPSVPPSWLSVAPGLVLRFG